MMNWMTDHGLCDQYPDLVRYFNLCSYSVLDMALITFGTVFWCVAYYAIIRNAFRNGFAEMPMMVAAANIAWEFVWSFTNYHTDMGLFFHWGFRVWFIMDVLIFYNVYKHGHKQMVTDLFRKHFKPVFLAITALWVAAVYTYAKAGLDTPIAANSAYVITVIMSSLYITLFLSQNNVSRFSFKAAWAKGVGSGFMTIFVFVHYKESLFLQLLGVVVAILDAYYIYLFYTRLKQSDRSQTV